MRTLIVYPIDPEVTPTEMRACMLNARTQQDLVPTSLLFTPPFTRRGALLGWAEMHGVGHVDLEAPRKHSRSARLLYHQRCIEQCDALILMRRAEIPSTHTDLLMRAVREQKRLFVWFLANTPHTRPLVLLDDVIWPDGCRPDPFEERQQWHKGGEDE